MTTTLALSVALLMADRAPAHIPQLIISDSSSTGIAYAIKSNDKGKSGVLILSCAHSKKKGDEVKVVWSKGEAGKGKVIAIDPVHDLSVVRCEDHWPRMSLLPLMPKDWGVVGIGEEVTINGYGSKGHLIRTTKIRDMTTVDMRDSGRRHSVTRVEAPVRRGDSGAPVVYKGKIEGIMIGFFYDKGNEDKDGAYIDHAQIWEFLEAVKLTP